MPQKEERSTKEKRWCHCRTSHQKWNKKFYTRIQEVTQEFKPNINVCRSEDGKIMTENEDV